MIEQLNDLSICKQTLVEKLISKDIVSTYSEPLLNLVNKVSDIESGVGQYVVVVECLLGDTVYITKNSDGSVIEQTRGEPVSSTDDPNKLTFFLKETGDYSVRIKRGNLGTEYLDNTEIWSEERNFSVQANNYVYNISSLLFKQIAIIAGGILSSKNTQVIINSYINYLQTAPSNVARWVFYWPCDPTTKNPITSLNIQVINGSNSKTGTVNYDNTMNQQSFQLNFLQPIFKDNDWVAIQEAVKGGVASNYWKVGDAKPIVLNGTIGKLSLSNQTFNLFILGFNQDKTNSMALMIQNVALVDSSYGGMVGEGIKAFNMNDTATTSGGWKDSGMRSLLNSSFYQALPSDFRNVLNYVTKYTDNVGGSNSSSNVTSTRDKIFLLAEYEVLGKTSYASSYESSHQKQYAYFKNGNSKIFYKHNDTSKAAWYYLRSPRSGSTSSFCNIGTGGTSLSSSANYSGGLAPVFAIC